MSDVVPFEVQMEIVKKVDDVSSLIRFRYVSNERRSFIDSCEFIAGYGFRHTQPPRFMQRYLHYQEREKEDELLDDLASFKKLFNIDMFDTSVNKILGFMKRGESVLKSCQELEESDLLALYLAI
ncbi:hypothetical protein Tco_0615911 [Tanacetum coccineum]